MSYAWQKIHLAAESIRNNSGDKRSLLTDAYNFELSYIDIDDEDIPSTHNEALRHLLNQLSLPHNVETMSADGHTHKAVELLSEKEVEDIIKLIFKLEIELNKT